MSQMWMSHVAHRVDLTIQTIMMSTATASEVSMSHVTHVNESCHRCG